MKLDKGFSLFRGALLLNNGQWPEEKRLVISERDCNELHINNTIILLSGEKKRKGRRARSNLFPLARNSGESHSD